MDPSIHELFAQLAEYRNLSNVANEFMDSRHALSALFNALSPTIKSFVNYTGVFKGNCSVFFEDKVESASCEIAPMNLPNITLDAKVTKKKRLPTQYWHQITLTNILLAKISADWRRGKLQEFESDLYFKQGTCSETGSITKSPTLSSSKTTTESLSKSVQTSLSLTQMPTDSHSENISKSATATDTHSESRVVTPSKLSKTSSKTLSFSVLNTLSFSTIRSSTVDLSLSKSSLLTVSSTSTDTATNFISQTDTLWKPTPTESVSINLLATSSWLSSVSNTLEATKSFAVSISRSLMGATPSHTSKQSISNSVEPSKSTTLSITQKADIPSSLCRNITIVPPENIIQLLFSNCQYVDGTIVNITGTNPFNIIFSNINCDDCTIIVDRPMVDSSFFIVNSNITKISNFSYSRFDSQPSVAILLFTYPIINSTITIYQSTVTACTPEQLVNFSTSYTALLFGCRTCDSQNPLPLSDSTITIARSTISSNFLFPVGISLSSLPQDVVLEAFASTMICANLEISNASIIVVNSTLQSTAPSFATTVEFFGCPWSNASTLAFINSTLLATSCEIFIFVLEESPMSNTSALIVLGSAINSLSVGLEGIPLGQSIESTWWINSPLSTGSAVAFINSTILTTTSSPDGGFCYNRAFFWDSSQLSDASTVVIINSTIWTLGEGAEGVSLPEMFTGSSTTIFQSTLHSIATPGGSASVLQLDTISESSLKLSSVVLFSGGGASGSCATMVEITSGHTPFVDSSSTLDWVAVLFDGRNRSCSTAGWTAIEPMLGIGRGSNVTFNGTTSGMWQKAYFDNMTFGGSVTVDGNEPPVISLALQRIRYPRYGF
ncbi:MAG: hypothetical protein I8H75_05810 [Myxococcaceae bacterium]|nr:hypothetical protein [Myxococcaceae bacterium]